MEFIINNCKWKIDDKHFTNEDVCEIVASINDFINEILEKYRKEK